MIMYGLSIRQLVNRSLFKEIHPCRYVVRLLSQRLDVHFVNLHILRMKQPAKFRFVLYFKQFICGQ
jgi:hypothetical protein